jgi:hypothetical protein
MFEYYRHILQVREVIFKNTSSQEFCKRLLVFRLNCTSSHLTSYTSLSYDTEKLLKIGHLEQ